MESTILTVKAQSRATLDLLTEEFTCHTLKKGGSVIIDLGSIVDDPDRLDVLSQTSGISKREIEGVDYICFYA